MKIIKQKTKTLLFLPILSISLLLVSCGGSNSILESKDADLRKQEDIAKIQAAFDANTTPEMLIQSISFPKTSSTENFTFSKDEISITFVNPENNKVSKGINVNIATKESEINKFVGNTPAAAQTKVYNGVTPENVNFGNLVKAVNSAIEALEANGTKASGLGRVEITFYAGAIKRDLITITLESKTETKNSGRITTVLYDEYTIQCDLDGNIIQK